MKINGETDTLDVVMVMGKSIQYPQVILLNKDSLLLTWTLCCYATVNSNSVLFVCYLGYRNGTFSVDGNKIIFVPAERFFKGEEVNFMLKQTIKYESENSSSLSRATGFLECLAGYIMGNFVIRPAECSTNMSQ